VILGSDSGADRSSTPGKERNVSGAGLRTGLRHRLQRARLRIEGQHQRLRTLLHDAEEAARTGAALNEPLHRLREGLNAHFELEEAVSFPALHGLEPASSRVLAVLQEDHHGFLDELARLLGGEADSAARVLRLGSALRDHERREEELLSRLLASDTPRA
jgi:Hemerythrin HHE cation binding domain